jgi:lactate 2-monooxygenase
MYAGGSAGTNSTFRANLRAFDKYGIIPRMLVNANQRSLEVGYFVTLQDFNFLIDNIE